MRLVKTGLTVASGSEDGQPQVRVLIADDSVALRKMVRITLMSQGWEILEAETGRAALDRAIADHPDVVLLDITFGDDGPDGLAICAELTRDPRTSAIPVVILTAHDDPMERQRADEAGAAAFIAKPFGPLDLTRSLRELLPAVRTPGLGVFLIDAGVVPPSELESTLEAQRALQHRGTPKRLGDLLVERGLVSHSELDRALAEQERTRAQHAGEHGGARVLIVDDHRAVREGLRELLNGEEGVSVVGEAANAREALAFARRLLPDMIILDNEMPGGSGLDLLPILRVELPNTRIVVFSLDGQARERAQALGAAFVSKDAPSGEILRAIRPDGRLIPGPAFSGLSPARVLADMRTRRFIGTIAVCLVAYAGVFVVLEPWVGAAAGAFSVLPVLIAGVILGPEGGLVAAALAILLTGSLWAATDHGLAEPVLQVGGQGFGMTILLLVGLSAGAARSLGLRLDPRRRRVEAIAEAASALVDLEGPRSIRLLLDALLAVVPAEVVAMFAHGAAAPRLLAATRDPATLKLGPTTEIVRRVMRAGAAHVTNDVPEEDRALPGLQALAVVPVAIAGHDVLGAIVVLRRGPAGFTPLDLEVIRPFAQYFWLVLRNAPARRRAAAAGLPDPAR